MDLGTLPTARELFLLLQQVFEVERPTMAPDAYLKTLLGNPHFIGLAAIHEKAVVGGLVAYELPMYHEACSEVFIYDIAVAPEFQRRGVGSALLSAIKSYCSENSIADLFVDAHEVDTHALDFYRSTRPREEKVVQFSYLK